MLDTEKRDRVEHYVGAAGEHYVASAFLKNKCQVYWPSVQQSATDFVVKNAFGLQTVQVKSAYWNKSGKYSYLQCRISSTKKYKDIDPTELYDILAVVDSRGRIWLIPSEDINSSNISLDGTKPGYKPKYGKYLWQHLTFGEHFEL